MGMAATFFVADACGGDLGDAVRAASSRLGGPPDGGFDLVTGTLVVPFFSDLELGLGNLRALSKRGAPLVLTIWDGTPPLEPVMASMIELCGLRKKKVSKDLSVDEVVAALPRAGWASPKSAPATTAYKWDCFNDCWQWILHHAPSGFKEHANDDQLAQGRNYIYAHVKARSPPTWTEDAPIALEVPVSIVLANAA